MHSLNFPFRFLPGIQNSTTNGAGGLSLTDSNLTVSNCSFTSNTAAFQGGAIIWEDSNGSIVDSNFTENINTTSNGGGAIRFKILPLQFHAVFSLEMFVSPVMEELFF